MALTVTWKEWNGSQTPGTFDGTTVTTTNFGSTDAADLTSADYPISQNTNSYDKYLKVQFSGAFTKISNAKFYKSAGAYVSGEDILFSGAVAMATPSQTSTGDPSIPTASPGSANFVLAGGITSATLPRGADVNSSPGYYSGSRSDLFRLQLQTDGTTPAGPLNTKTFTLTYDRQ